MNLKELKYNIENTQNFKIDENYLKFFVVSLYDLQQAFQKAYPSLKIKHTEYFDESAICSKHTFSIVSNDSDFEYTILKTRTGYEDDMFLGYCDEDRKLKYFGINLLATDHEYKESYLFVDMFNKKCDINAEYPKFNGILWKIVYNKVAKKLATQKQNCESKIKYVESNPELKCFDDSVHYGYMKQALPDTKKLLSQLSNTDDTDLSLI